ncbi:hypothetical protein [Enterococcus sp. DIV0187]
MVELYIIFAIIGAILKKRDDRRNKRMNEQARKELEQEWNEINISK